MLLITYESYGMSTDKLLNLLAINYYWMNSSEAS